MATVTFHQTFEAFPGVVVSCELLSGPMSLKDQRMALRNSITRKLEIPYPLQSFGRLPNSEILLTSTHTSKGETPAQAFAWSKGSEYRGIGIDMEWTKRKIKNKTALGKKIANQNDVGKRDFLELWCVKEAAFKSISMQKDSKIQSLNEISVGDEKFKDQAGGSSGSWSVIYWRDYILALAVLK